ncbi:3-oxoacyl-ACP reductase [Bacillus xiamenensis]|uniref:3-oxoacyl-ACP reductase n=1 Tax=Bacillus xiamenensis TaxID=1178537 RepID=A0AAC9N9U9_9BACI|nr:SDR family oxidoreductase [Bacillus xiamenensis]AOZ87501.1 3-oxoacyl-ACP reductase [Bacillus xiamenensis]MBG9912422.1 3-oxoacyl-ACP reductase [Bacillus xiamenensis]MCW1836397.1 SDR family oxidoreductase [Bacillus xiamenensis]MCY9574667.1 SDR family oxidoreductase [Bacillus xiamenensis]
MDVNLSGKKALVAASSQGIGKAIAFALAKEGADVMLSGRHEQTLKETVKELSPLVRGHFTYQVCDVSDAEQIKALVTAAAGDEKCLDILVNNTGGPQTGTLETLTDEDWMESFQLHLLSYIRLLKEALPYLKKRGARVLNIASMSVKEPIPGLMLSNTFRPAIAGWTKAAAQELAKDGILINTLGPGKIETERVKQLDKYRAQTENQSIEEIKAQAERAIPLGRYGQPEEFATYAAFLLSEANTYMTGQTLIIDGGLTKSL